MKTQKEKYIHSFLETINASRLISNMKYLPRSIVLLLDVIILIFSIILIKAIFRESFIQFAVSKSNSNLVLGLILSVNVFCFILLKTFSGIVRHSTLIDGIKIFFTQFLTLIVLLVVNVVSIFTGSKLFINNSLIIYFLFSCILLFGYRILIKFIFDKLQKESNNQLIEDVLVVGTDANAIAVANALNNQNPSKFRVKGFVDVFSQNHSKTIMNLPIIALKKSISTLLRSRKANGIILSDSLLSKEQKMKLVDDCIEYNFKVYTTQLIENWENSDKIFGKIKKFEIQDLLGRKEIVLDKSSISSQIKGKVVLVTGAAGSIGSEIARQLLEFNPKQLIILDQAESPLYDLDLELKNRFDEKIILPVLCDIRNSDDLSIVFKKHKPNVVYHAAAYKHVPLMEQDPKQAIMTNVLGTKHVADLAIKNEVDSFVMVSTDKAVNPSNVMGASKRIAELYVSNLANKTDVKTKFITTRFGNVLGSNGSVVPLFTEQIRKGGPITITHPDIFRYFMTIPEACQLVLEAGAMGKGGEIFVFDMDEPVKIVDLANKMIKLAGYEPNKDIKIKFIGLRPGEKLYEELISDSSSTLPTHHKKIMILKDNVVNDNINSLLQQLFDSYHFNTPKENVKLMKTIVPEFISQNSEYQDLDD